MAPTKEEAQKSFDAFISLYEAKYPKAIHLLNCSIESGQGTELLFFKDGAHYGI